MTDMRYVQIGDLRVSAVGLGTWQLGSPEWGWGREFGIDEARQLLHRALDLGINFFDTAEIYGKGQSEQVLGAVFKGLDHEILVATKVWPTRFTPGAIGRAARASLRRLGRPTIDLYQIHWPNPLLPLAWSMEGMRRLVDEGLVRHVAVSNFGLRRWARAERLLGRPVVSNQVRYHLLDRRPERDLLPYATGAGRAIIAYSPLAQGLLGGGFGLDYRPSGARSINRLFWPENLRRTRPVVEAVSAVAQERGVSPAQIALAWVLRDPAVVAIPGARKAHHVEDSAVAADLHLDAEAIARLEAAAAACQPAGLLRAAAGSLRRCR